MSAKRQAVSQCGALALVWTFAAISFFLQPARPSWAQAGQSPRGQGLGEVIQFVVRPTLSLGAMVLWYDAGGDAPFHGYAVRVGSALAPVLGLSVSGEYWPELGPRRAWAIQGEAIFFPVGRRRLAPYLMLHLGHFWTALPPGTIYTTEPAGLTKGFGLGFHGRVRDPLGISLEGLVRFDPRAANEQVRALVTYAPGIQRWPRPVAQLGLFVYGMIRLSGPWHFVEPGYGIESVTWVTTRDALALTVAVLHWQIPEPRRLLVPYLWDTRAVLVVPAWRRGKHDGILRWYIEGGPALTTMIEGPDGGLRAGANVEVGGSVDLRSLPRLTAGVGWFWVVRSSSDDLVRPTDQHGLLFQGGIGF
ncbi:MAG: hypothetical protein KatS3mg081_0851 [Gemmatimonadales bacterium]|nr:MAG: hypothetical protein KatS3mg081_0851 [Gemmatimonadales bacterium]